jgi:hypothetical protein
MINSKKYNASALFTVREYIFKPCEYPFARLEQRIVTKRKNFSL